MVSKTYNGIDGPKCNNILDVIISWIDKNK